MRNATKSRAEHFADVSHPNDDDAWLIAEEVFPVLTDIGPVKELRH